MAQDHDGHDIPMTAGENLTAAQYLFVVMSGDLECELAGLNEEAVGILQDAPDEGETGRVRVGGTSKLVMAEACSPGALITPTAAGKGEVVDGNNEWCAAQALEEAEAGGDVIEVLIRGFNVNEYTG